jgi:hypothetical protein
MDTDGGRWTVRVPASVLGGVSMRSPWASSTVWRSVRTGVSGHVDVAASQSDELTEAESAEAGEEDERPVALLDGVGQGEHDPGVDEGSLGGAFNAGAAEATRVGGDPLVFDGGVQDDPQQTVGLGRLERAKLPEKFGVPAADILGAQLVEWPSTESGHEVPIKERTVKFAGSGCERSPVGASPFR